MDLKSSNLLSPGRVHIIYRSKDNRQEKIFDALDWLAAMTSNIPDQGESRFRRDFAIVAIIVTFPGGFVKRKIRMPSFPVFWNLSRASRSNDQMKIKNPFGNGLVVIGKLSFPLPSTLAFRLIFLLDPVFFLFYTLP